MDTVEIEASTVEEAVAAALSQMGRREDEVEVEVLSKGSHGIFGFGAKPARVKVKVKEGGVLPPDAIGRATDFLIQVVKLMGMDVEVEAKHFGNELYLEIDQGAGGILIGRHGTTLAALSTLMERIVNKNEDARVKVFVDVAGYLERKRRSLVTMATEMAQEAKRMGREVACGPMSAFERKVIHTTLHNDHDVKTFSRGEGMERRVIITPATAESESVKDPAQESGRREEFQPRGRGPREGGDFGGDGRNGGGRRRRGRPGRRGRRFADGDFGGNAGGGEPGQPQGDSGSR
jgi:spoIIIJ-associated protein